MFNNTKLLVSILLAAVISISGIELKAQNAVRWDGTSIPDGYELFDSVIFHPIPSVDSSLCHISVRQALDSTKAGVDLYQSQILDDALNAHIAQNKTKEIYGWRVRIFRDNSKTAKSGSLSVKNRFHDAYPGIPVYMTYSNPYFKVAVGDFRTKADAMQLLKSISSRFPKAFVIKENINYPQFDNVQNVVADTVKFMRKVNTGEDQAFFNF